jgi:hypothetical protein
MPTNRRHRGREREAVDGLSEVAYLYFTFGPFFEAEGFADGKTPQELRGLWRRHRSAIMARYMAENRAKGPGWEGIRPDMFWEELEEPRRKTAPGEFSSQKVWDHQRRVHDWVETDLAYLRRLGLLEPWELAAHPELSE